MLRFGILGPLIVERDGEPVMLPRSTLLRKLLGVLLAVQGAPLPVERLAELVWPRKDAVRPGSVHVTVSRLRRWLAGLSGGRDEVPLVHDHTGYRLVVDPAAVDLGAFRDLVARARTASSADEQYDLLCAATALCRGPVLDDPGADVGDLLLRRIHEEVREAGLALAEVAVATGRAGDAVGWLDAFVRREPLDEPAHAALISVLAACGRPAEALARHEQLRRLLADELGVSPGDVVQQAYLTVLAEESDAADGDRARRRRPSPGLLPPDIADFTGREGAIREILDAYADPDRPPTAVRVITLTGQAGIGKTTVAVRAGHLLRDVYGDGQLYIDLHGVDAHPVAPAVVLARFLRALGVDGAALPPELDERIELYRDKLARQRMLVVLDNAAGEWQIRPLLPGNPSCAVLVTSRRPFTGLGRSMRLDFLDRPATVELLGLIAGSARVAAEPDAAAEIARLCGGLPLAVRIAGGRLARLPHRPLRWLADRLADDRHRLDELRLEDLEVRASLELSYRNLSRPARTLFSRLGSLDTRDIPAWCAADLMDVDATAAEELLDELVEAHLLVVTKLDGHGWLRYRLHDLVRVYAREQADDPRLSLLRALRGWHTRAGVADRVLHHPFPRATVNDPNPGADAPGDDEIAADAPAWFDTERAALVAAVHQAHSLGADELCWDLASRLTGFFETRGLYEDWYNTHHLALGAARRAGDGRGEAAILHRLGEMHANQDRYDEALRLFAQARDILRVAGDRLWEAYVLRSAGVAQRMVGEIAEARKSLETALVIFAAHGEKTGIAVAQHGLGAIHREQGRLDAATASYRQALELFEEAGDLFTQSLAQCSLGVVLRLAGRQEQAAGCFMRSLELARAVGHQPGEALVLCYLGEMQTDQGNIDLARSLLESARSLSESIGERFGLALAWMEIGKLHRHTGDLAASLGALNRSLTIWTDLNLPLWRARTLEAIGEVQDQRGCRAEAHNAWQFALALFQALQAPEADHVASRMARAGHVETSVGDRSIRIGHRGFVG
jgi:DNA-binding SARP family transcriptional activator/predicted negative regulator of RcsB-dependent stress response